MKFPIQATISLESDQPSTLLQTLLPENKDVPPITIDSRIDGQEVNTHIDGEMKIGSLLVIIDDILKTAELSRQVSETTNS